MAEALAYFHKYDKSKYSVPWVCKVKQNGVYDFSECIGGYSGRHGDEGYLYVFNPIKGQVYGYGQKRYYYDQYSIIRHAVWNGKEFCQCNKFGILEVCNNDEAKIIDDMSTAEIINYLVKREGISWLKVDPYVKKEISVEGPAVVVVVTD